MKKKKREKHFSVSPPHRAPLIRPNWLLISGLTNNLKILQSTNNFMLHLNGNYDFEYPNAINMKENYPRTE